MVDYGRERGARFDNGVPAGCTDDDTCEGPCCALCPDCVESLRDCKCKPAGES
jgi:hypothetical protein